MIGSAGEIVLPRRVHRQPTPFIVSGGDCGACVLGGALGVPIEYVYDVLREERQSISQDEMARMLRVSVWKGLCDRVILDPADWRSPSSWCIRAFGHPGYYESVPWFNYVRMAVDAGMYGLAEVDSTRSGGQSIGGTNHWVMICGARTEGAVNGKTMTGEVMVSCSSLATPDEEWVEARDFLRNRGGYDLLFVRPCQT